MISNVFIKPNVLRLKFIYIILIILFTVFYFFSPAGMDKMTILFLIVAVFLCSIPFFLKKERYSILRGQYFRHTTIALLGIYIVFFQVPIDYLLGNIGYGNFFIWVNHKIVIKSLILSLIGLLSFFLGNIWYKKKNENKGALIKEKPIRTNLLNVIAGTSLLIYFLTINPLYLVGGYYGNISVEGPAQYAINFFHLFIFASLIQKNRNILLSKRADFSFVYYLKKIGWPTFLLIVIYLLSVLISGDRGPLIVYSLLILSGYLFITKIKIKLTYIALFIFFGALSMNILGLARSGGMRGMNFSEKIVEVIGGPLVPERYGYVSFFPPTQELSLSYNTLNTVVNFVPRHHDFFYGRFQFQRIGIIIPFFSQLYPIIFKDNDQKYRTSANYITWIRQGNYPVYGNGTSAMADLYLDFGVIGVFLGMFLFGYMMRFSEVAMYERKLPTLFVQSFFMIFICYALYIARGSIFSNLLTVVWVYVILLINKHVSLKKS